MCPGLPAVPPVAVTADSELEACLWTAGVDPVFPPTPAVRGQAPCCRSCSVRRARDRLWSLWAWFAGSPSHWVVAEAASHLQRDP